MFIQNMIFLLFFSFSIEAQHFLTKTCYSELRGDERNVVQKILDFLLLDQTDDLEYQKSCNKEQKDYTKWILQKSLKFSVINKDNPEGMFCFNCDQNLVNQEDLLCNYVNQSHRFLPKRCFLDSALDGLKHEFRTIFCDHQDFKDVEAVTKNKQKHCINKDYIYMISKTFYEMAYCFNFSKEDQFQAFRLINHESRFILNARSRTYARCLGQVTKEYVETINNIIKDKNHEYYSIYGQVLDRCPDLESRKISLKDLCISTHDPYTCLFYTFFGLKRSQRAIYKALNSPLSYHSYLDNDMKSFLKLPLNLNEVLILKGEIKINGRLKNIHWLIWDDSEIAIYIKKYNWTAYDLSKLMIFKLPLIENSLEVERMFSSWSHNAGSSLFRLYVPTFFEDLKFNISRSCSKEKKTIHCLLRQQILSEKGLSTKQIHDEFKSWIKKNYQTKDSDRKAEVANFYSKLVSDSKAIFKDESACPKNSLNLDE